MNRSRMFWMVVLAAVFVVQPFAGIFAQEDSNTPSLEVNVFNANGSRPLGDVKVTIQEDAGIVQIMNETKTNEEGVARFERKDFKDFIILTGFSNNARDRNRYDGQSSLRQGSFKVTLVVTAAGDVTEKRSLRIPLSEAMSYRVNMSRVD